MDKPGSAREPAGLDKGELASPASTERDGDWLRKPAFLALLPILMIALLAGLFVLGKAMLFPSTAADEYRPGGDCSLLDPHWCTSLHLSYIESLAGIELQEGTDVTDSGSWRSLKSGHEWATVRLPEGTSTSEPETHADQSMYHTVIQVRRGTDGRPVLTIERFWNG
jgi:hypothetical protein